MAQLDKYTNKFIRILTELDPVTIPKVCILCGIYTNGLQPKALRDHLKSVRPLLLRECVNIARDKCMDFISVEAKYKTYRKNFDVKIAKIPDKNLINTKLARTTTTAVNQLAHTTVIDLILKAQITAETPAEADRIR